jgi:hypothetical protein
MSKKGRDKFRVHEIDPFSDDDPLDFDDFDYEDLTREVHSVERDEIFEKEERFSTRRKIERRKEMKELYSQFDEWDESDQRNHW